MTAARDDQSSIAPSSHSLADQVVLISSVSGGSVASAYYVSQNYPHLRVMHDRDLWLSINKSPRECRRDRAYVTPGVTRLPTTSIRGIAPFIAQMLDAARSGRGSEVSDWAGSRFENAVERVAYECERLARGGNIWQTAGGSGESIAPWLATSAVRRRHGNRLHGALVAGNTLPGPGARSERDAILGGGVWLARCRRHRSPSPAAPDPAGIGHSRQRSAPVLFNTCDVKQGTRLIVGFPPVPPGIIRDPLAGTISHLPYSLTDRGNLYYHVSLAEAVRLSANFPFGFEVARLPVEGTGETVLALDGGIVDNSGIDSIVSLLQGLERLAKAYRQEWRRLAFAYRQAQSDELRNALWQELTDLSCKRIEGRAFRLLGELAHRKVVLLQIDSGAKVIETGGSALTRLLASLPVILRPVQALNNTTYTNAELSVHQYDLALANLKPQPPPPCTCEDGPALAQTRTVSSGPAHGRSRKRRRPGAGT